MRTIIDTHAHLYELTDPFAVLSESAASGVSDIIALGVDLASNLRHLEIKKSKHAPVRIHLGWGLHPGNMTLAQDTEACFEFFRLNIQEAIAIGETGLDYWYKWVRKDESRKREQREVFDRHLGLAREFSLPVVIHSRGAWRDCFDMAKSSGVTRANFHWYSGPEDVLRNIIDSGFMISCTPSLAYSAEARKAVLYAPLDRILIETDTPVAYAFQEVTESRNSKKETDGDISSPELLTRVPSTPKDVWRTLRLLSELKERPEDEILTVVNDNARRFFCL